MPYCITLRSKTDGRITGWYVGGHGWSTDHKRQKLFDQNAMPDQYAMSCAASARTIAQSSTLKQSRTTLLSTWRRPCLRAKDLAHRSDLGAGKTRGRATRPEGIAGVTRRSGGRTTPVCIGGVR